MIKYKVPRLPVFSQKEKKDALLQKDGAMADELQEDDDDAAHCSCFIRYGI